MINSSDIFPLGIGTWGIGGYAENDDSIDAEKQIKALMHMFNKGMNFVEVNVWYAGGYSVELVAEAIKRSNKTRNDIFICCAIYLKDKTLDDLEVEVDKTLKLLNTDWVDTIQLNQSTFIRNPFDEVTKIIDLLISQSKTRYTSITNHDSELLKKYHAYYGDKLFSHEVCVNFEIRPDENLRSIEYAKNNSINTVIYQPLRRNRTALRNWPLLSRLAAKYKASHNQVLISWYVSNGYIPITKSETIEHINDYLAAVSIKLEQKDIQELNLFKPQGYKEPKIDWSNNGEGVLVDQLSNVFDEQYL